MIKPHGADALKPLLVSDRNSKAALLAEAEALPSLTLNSAAAANAVMLGGGYFTPLDGFMNLADGLSVSETMHTTDGLFWPVPVLNLTDDISAIEGASRIALRDPNVAGEPVLAVMNVRKIEHVTEVQIDTMAGQVFGTLDEAHPGVAVFRKLRNLEVATQRSNEFCGHPPKYCFRSQGATQLDGSHGGEAGRRVRRRVVRR